MIALGRRRRALRRSARACGARSWRRRGASTTLAASSSPSRTKVELAWPRWARRWSTANGLPARSAAARSSRGWPRRCARGHQRRGRSRRGPRSTPRRARADVQAPVPCRPRRTRRGGHSRPRASARGSRRRGRTLTDRGAESPIVGPGGPPHPCGYWVVQQSLPTQGEADPHAVHDADRAGDRGAHERPILVRDAEAMDVCAGLAELIGQHAGLGSGELERLLNVLLGAQFAAVCRVFPSLGTPLFAGACAESTDARDQSIAPARWRRSSRLWCLAEFLRFLGD